MRLWQCQRRCFDTFENLYDYFCLVLTLVEHDEAVPFSVKVSNALTAQVLHKSEAGKYVFSTKNTDDLFWKLDI
jgi:DNA-damage-inducible protein J